MTETTDARGTGWLTFAGIMLVTAGLLDIYHGLWAIDRGELPVDSWLFENDLDTWGWIHIVIGIALVVIGIAIFGGATWARWAGMVAAMLALLINMTWVFTAYPIAALILCTINILVIYGLALYEED